MLIIMIISIPAARCVHRFSSVHVPAYITFSVDQFQLMTDIELLFFICGNDSVLEVGEHSSVIMQLLRSHQGHSNCRLVR